MTRRSGFTLIELLIVISIIGILSVIGMVAYSTFLKNSRDAKRQSDLKFIQSALEEYHSDQLYYPSGTTLGSSITNGKTPLKTYLTTVPNDPKDQSAYSYVAQPSGCATAACTSYCLSASLENLVGKKTEGNCSNPSGPYNFTVTRP